MSCSLAENFTSEDDKFVVGEESDKMNLLLASSPLIVKELPGNLLDSLPNLGTFYVNEVGLERMSVKSFKSCRKMVWLELKNNLLTEIPDRVFKYCNNLKFLMLSDNKIPTLGDEAFVGLGKLTKFDFSGNKLREIGNETFKPFVRAENLDLSRNQIT